MHIHTTSRSITVGLLLIGLLASISRGQESTPRQSEHNWEYFSVRFWRPLPGNKITSLKNQQTLAYGHHLHDPDHIAHLLALGSFHFHLLEFDQAAAMYLRALEIEPDNIDAQAWFAECLYHAGSSDLALPLFEAIERTGKSTPVTNILRAEIYYRSGEIPTAKDLLMQVVRKAKAESDTRAYAPYRRFTEHAEHNLTVLIQHSKTQP